MPTTHLDFALKNVRGLWGWGIYGPAFALRNQAQAMEAARMVESPRLNEIWELEREADRLREARDNLEALIGLALQVPILQRYVDTFSEAVSAVKDRLREIGMDDPKLSETLSTD